MSTYYYLISGLPDLSPEDGRLAYTVENFKSEVMPELSGEDRKLVELFYLKYDNENLLKLLKDKEAPVDPRGNFTADELNALIAAAKEDEEAADKRFPDYFYTFLAEYFQNSTDETFRAEDVLTADYYDYGMKCPNRFIASWFEFNLNVNNILTAFLLRKYRRDVHVGVIGKTEVSRAVRKSNARDFGLGGELDYFEQLVRISETEDLVERERKTDLLKWNWMEEASFFDYFTVERIFVFLLRLEMIGRWISLDKEKGYELFRQLIRKLQEEVQVPGEFKVPGVRK